MIDDVVVQGPLAVSDGLDSSLSVYPSPASGTLNLSFVNRPKGDGVIVRLYDMHGSLVLQDVASTKNHTLNISNLKPGLYSLLAQNSRQTTSRKIYIN